VVWGKNIYIKKNRHKNILGWPGKILCGKFEQETHYRMSDASEEKVTMKLGWTVAETAHTSD
jgi:hypothetical protein